MRICLILEGCYPYVNGGVSSWMHNYINEMTEHEFVLVTIGANAESRGKFKYELADNVVEVKEVFLDDAFQVSGNSDFKETFNDMERQALKDLLSCQSPDWEVLFDIFYQRQINPTDFLESQLFLELLTEIVEEKHQNQAFADVFHTTRSMLLTVLYLMTQDMPKADVYHSIATGYAGLLASLGSYQHQAPLLLTEHGIYTREREEEILRSDWVLPTMKRQWIQFFYMLSNLIYDKAERVTSLYTQAKFIQEEVGCDIEKCRVISNGIHYDRFSAIPLKEEDGWIDIGAVVRIAPIKDIKTMLYVFYELSRNYPNTRLHILGAVDDEDYNRECHQLIRQLGIKNVSFTGQVNVVEYMENLDFTILTSISEAQPLSVIESMAARRPCVTTDVGCCRELLEGNKDDHLGIAGYCIPPTYRTGLTHAMEKMCSSRQLRLKMGEIAQKRAKTYYLYEMMIQQYRDLYLEVV
ncbi:GT4 family glycosyltransferase PelF [Streptococcus gallolyticus]|uniref:Glycosyltransferase involved in cell wall bisynthesis n=1 Tax=Streptococcus gallolyticus TaxID=315405 RepID=A0A1H9S8Q1_9STRE|nr:GT4 family glycosyltransferase PelF [Streptococcus gallolyticus]SER80559.1 Glycosyltransferase involved in cell wall bisynthesis [Streptococcus gallolyticus]